MKIGVFAVLFGDKTLDETLNILQNQGVQMIEIGCGGFPGKAHCNPAELLADESKLAEFKATLAKYPSIQVSALSCHGNPVHPNKEIAQGYIDDLKNAVLLAEKLEVPVVNTFSGCPGDSEHSLYPNWVTCPWPDDFGKILDWQWNEKLVPFWCDFSKFAKSHGVEKIALELHPGFCVYNTSSMLRLHNAVKDAVGESGALIGANFDPSHLWWQGMDPVMSIRELGGIIYHFHAKDTNINEYNTAVNGVLDTSTYGAEISRSWIFRTLGYGHDRSTWNDIFSTLRMVGYDYAISIEHEDSLMSAGEGLSKAIDFLKDTVIFEEKTAATWF